MVKPKKYLWRHPSGRVYVRIKGATHRIKAVEGTADFDIEYWEIVAGKRDQAKTSWNALIKDYRSSDRWRDLKPRTRQDYEKVLEYISEKNGARDVRTLTRADVIAAQRKNEHRTRFANYIPQMFVVLCEHAIDIGWLKDNPAKGVRALKTPAERKQAHVPWPDWAVEHFRGKSEGLPRLIFEIGIGSVQRPSDWLRFTWGDYDGESLKITQGKTGRVLVLPCTAQLKEFLDTFKSQLVATPHPARKIIVQPNGNPMNYRYMAEVMRAERKRLGLLAFDLHAMRYRGVMELAWKGCTDEEIASFSGHASLTMIRQYAGEARQIMRARQANDKRK